MTVNSKRTSITSSGQSSQGGSGARQRVWQPCQGGGKGGGARVGVGVVECCIFICNTFPVSAVGGVIGRAEFHNVVFHRWLICTPDPQKQLRPVAGGAGLV